jgi:hypothetical protein
MNEVETAKLLSIANKFAQASTEDLRHEISERFMGPNYQLEKARLLSIASRFAFSEANEAKREILEEIKRMIAESDTTLNISEVRLRGPQGERGDRGEIGPIGLRGLKGERGDFGEQGPAGIIGPVGPRGDNGDKGDKGDRGDRGLQGPEGDISSFRKELDDFRDAVDKRISRIAFSAASGLARSPGSGEVNLHKLDDVDYSSLKGASDGQSLVYNATTGKWQASTISVSGGIATVSTAELGSLTENDLVVVNVTGNTVTSNTVGTLTSALNNALARIEDLEARLLAAGIS